MKEEIIKSFDRIALLDDKWDHNQNYGDLLLREVEGNYKTGLDIGCGTGEFTRRLSKKLGSVLGIDISPVMIREAVMRHPEKNIIYAVQDFDELEESKKYDCIVSIATFHHLDLNTALPKINRLLSSGGKLIVLDLYERKGIIDLFLDITAIPANFVIKKIKNGGRKSNKEEYEAWKEHSKIDKYMTFSELKSLYSHMLSEGIKIKRLLFWRYLMVYRKN